MQPNPIFIQGVFTFEGVGLSAAEPLYPPVTYKVPADKRAQLVYLRAGNSCSSLVNLTLNRNGKPMRLFPIGAQAAMHVSLTVVEDLDPESELEVLMSAPEGMNGKVVIDMGILEVD